MDRKMSYSTFTNLSVQKKYKTFGTDTVLAA